MSAVLGWQFCRRLSKGRIRLRGARAFGFLALLVVSGTSSAKDRVVIDFSLSPMGSFKGRTSDVKGFAVLKSNQEVVAENIVVGLKNIKTGIALRDRHTQDHLGTAQHPEAILISATGKNGKGLGRIKIRGIEKKISGTYRIKGNALLAEFLLNIADFGIKDVRYMNVGLEDEIKLKVLIPVRREGAAQSAASKN